MVGQLPRSVLALAAVLVAAASYTVVQAERPLLARYGFEVEEALASGPDSFAVFKPQRGDVALSAELRLDGARSVRLTDRPGDGDFPEFQGYFPLRRAGRLAIRFSLLTPDPAMPWHVALAGPGGFAPRQDGIAFWLRAEDGVLRHVSDGIPRRLLSLRGFVWYSVAIDYDAGAGTYDLEIRAEGGDAPIVSLHGQSNVTAQPNSAVNVLSFVGDVLGDRRPSELFLDEIVLDDGSAPLPERAPGRRLLFVDEWWGTARNAPLESVDAAERGWLDALQREAWGGAETVAQARLAHASDPAARALWLEHAGDAAYLASDPAGALRYYMSATEIEPNRASAWLRRADMHFLLEEVEAERDCRERIYGALRDN